MDLPFIKLKQGLGFINIAFDQNKTRLTGTAAADYKKDRQKHHT